MATTKIHPAIAPLVKEEQQKRDAEIRSSQAGRDRQPMARKCVFVSVWDGDITLRSNAIFRAETGSIEVLETHDVDGLEHLDREYIELPDGDELPVCQTCHEYVLRPAMVEGVGKSLTETTECSNPSCENKA